MHLIKPLLVLGTALFCTTNADGGNVGIQFYADGDYEVEAGSRNVRDDLFDWCAYTEAFKSLKITSVRHGCINA